MNPSKINQLWALLIAVLAVHHSSLVIASSTSGANASTLSATAAANLDIPGIPPRHQRMEKRFLGSLRSPVARKRETDGSRTERVRVGRGGVFEHVKKQTMVDGLGQEEAEALYRQYQLEEAERMALAQDSNTFDAVQLAGE